MFFSIKYKENEEKYIKLFGNIKEKCYFCSRVEIFASRDSKSEHVYEAIAEITHHDATLIKGEGCYSKQECDVLYSVVGRDEVST